MDGFMLAVSARSAPKGKQQWQTVFLKADEISAKLIAFSDRSQSQIRWSLGLVGADISTPVPGEPNFGISIDETPYCFYIRETSATSDCAFFFSASDDSAKKRWMKTLLQIARDGPKAPRFAATQAENDFAFSARVVKFRPSEQGAHAEYLVACSCQVFSKIVNRRMSKRWEVWHRFSEFDELCQSLQTSLGVQMKSVTFVKHKRDALRLLVGKSLDPEFLEERRMQLDTFVSQLCEIRTAVEFFKHHSDSHLKMFFRFEENCSNVDESPRSAKGHKSKGSRSNTQKSDASRASTASSRSSDADSLRSIEPIEHSRHSPSGRNSVDNEDAVTSKSRRGSKKKDKKRSKQHQSRTGNAEREAEVCRS